MAINSMVRDRWKGVDVMKSLDPCVSACVRSTYMMHMLGASASGVILAVSESRLGRDEVTLTLKSNINITYSLNNLGLTRVSGVSRHTRVRLDHHDGATALHSTNETTRPSSIGYCGASVG